MAVRKATNSLAMHRCAMSNHWIKFGVVLVTVAIILLGCSKEPAQEVSLSKVEPGTESSSQKWTCLGCKAGPSVNQEGPEQNSHYVRPEVLRVAVSAMTMPRETLGLYEELLRYLGDKMGQRVELVQRRTYQAANDLIQSKVVDAAFVCSLPYVLGHDKFGMELLVTTEIDSLPRYYSYIIVRKDSGIENFEELRGKTFAFMDPDSNSGTLYPTYRLAQMGESPLSFFHNYIYTYGHDNSVKAVLNNTVDGAAVENLIFNYMAAQDSVVASQIKVIEVSPPFASPPVVVHPELNSKIKEGLRSILLNMNQDDRGREILDRMNIDGFGLVRDSAYDSIREMYYAVKGAITVK